MTIFLPTLAVAVAAFCVWLTVRIVNWRERWAKRTLAGVLGLPVLYIASFGPACWINERFAADTKVVSLMYSPILHIASGRARLQKPILWYASAGSSRYCLILDGKIEWSPADWPELIWLIQSSVHPSTGDLVDSSELEADEIGPNETE